MVVSKQRSAKRTGMLRGTLFTLTLACGAVGLGGLAVAQTAQQSIGQQVISRNDVTQVAAAEELKSKAFEALRAGKFDQTTTFLSQAADVSKDPKLEQLAGWARQFEQQRQTFVAERQKTHKKAVGEAKHLIEHHELVYALDSAARAYLLAEDKEAFRKEPWVTTLVAEARKAADEAERAEEWMKALQLYADLGSMEPESAEWKEHLKTVTRRLGMLGRYLPAEIKKMQPELIKDRERVSKLLVEYNRKNDPDFKEPVVKEDTPKEGEERDEELPNWRDSLKGVKMEMLLEALTNARQHFYREVNYRVLLTGGLNGLRTILTTPALEKEFPGLADGPKKAQFLGTIDAFQARLAQVQARDEADLLREVLYTLELRNKSTVKLPEEVLVSEFADGAFSALDQFSNVIWPSDVQEFQKATVGEFSGVGIQIQIDDEGNLKVVSPLEDSPAYRAGIKPEWIVTHIDGKSARWISLNQAVKKITGPPNTLVTLTIKDSGGNAKDYALKRETIKIDSIKGWIHKPGGGWDYMVDPDQKIAYIRMTNFTKTSSQDLDDALDAMRKQGVRGLILDLRYNPGGLLTASTEVVDKFIKKGVIVSTRPDREDSAQKPSSMDAKNTRDEFEQPVIVLVNQYSASASEIVSGALKDHKRAKVIGERTFGKGSVQMLFPLVDRQRSDSYLKLTTSHYYLPGGKCIHREEYSKEWGVDPDVTVEMTPEQMRAAIDARQDFDILRDPTADPTPKDDQAREKAEAVEKAVEKAKKKDPLAVDAQLAAALLMMRMQLAGAAL